LLTKFSRAHFRRRSSKPSGVHLALNSGMMGARVVDAYLRAGGLERYQQFCLGRYWAFAELLPHSGPSEFRRHVPAATAIGTRSGPLQVFFLAGRSPGLHARTRASAYKYPPLYVTEPRRYDLRRLGLWVMVFVLSFCSAAISYSMGDEHNTRKPK
jgi:hypothetical protein